MRAVLVVIRVLQALVVRLGQVELLARVAQMVLQVLAVTAAMVATGITRALISTRLLERRAGQAVTEDQLAVWVTVVTVAMAATARRAATVQMV